MKKIILLSILMIGTTSLSVNAAFNGNENRLCNIEDSLIRLVRDVKDMQHDILITKENVSQIKEILLRNKESRDSESTSAASTAAEVQTPQLTNDAEIAKAKQLLEELKQSRGKNLVKTSIRDGINKNIQELCKIYRIEFKDMKLDTESEGYKSQRAVYLQNQLDSAIAIFGSRLAQNK